MAKKKLSQKQLSLLRADYLQKREALLVNEVDNIAVILFDKVFNKYLKELEQSDGVILYNEKNISAVKGLDKIYKEFNIKNNIPLIKKWHKDLYGILPLNETYFENIAEESVRAQTPIVKSAVDKSLGLTAEGKIVKNGFTDKFIKDDMILKKLKSYTNTAISSGQNFQVFKNNLKEIIQGVPNKALSGKVQQYYRNYAYDAYQTVDRLAQDTFANELGLNWFFWQGGLIRTSRNICIKCNSKLVNNAEYKKIKYSQLKDKFRDGLSPNWTPDKLGQHGCRHSKDYVSNAVAQQLKSRWLKVSDLTV